MNHEIRNSFYSPSFSFASSWSSSTNGSVSVSPNYQGRQRIAVALRWKIQCVWNITSTSNNPIIIDTNLRKRLSAFICGCIHLYLYFMSLTISWQISYLFTTVLVKIDQIVETFPIFIDKNKRKSLKKCKKTEWKWILDIFLDQSS